MIYFFRVVIIVLLFISGCDSFFQTKVPSEQEKKLLITKTDLELKGFYFSEKSDLVESTYKQKDSEIEQVVYSLSFDPILAKSIWEFHIFSEATKFNSWISMKKQIIFNFLFLSLMDLMNQIKKQKIKEFDCGDVECKYEILRIKDKKIGVRVSYFFSDRFYSFEISGQEIPDIKILQPILLNRIESFKKY